MSEFFKSEMVRGDLQEIAELQEYCTRSMMTFPALSPEKKLQYFDVLRKLIEKQKIFYARLKLSDDAEAVEMRENVKLAAIMFGASEDDDVESMFDELLEKIDYMSKITQSEIEADGG